MKSRMVVVSATLGFVVGAIVGLIAAFMYADAHPWMWFDDNTIGIPVLACIVSLGSTIIGASIGFTIATIRTRR